MLRLYTKNNITHPQKQALLRSFQTFVVKFQPRKTFL